MNSSSKAAVKLQVACKIKKNNPINSLKNYANRTLEKFYYLDHLISFSSSMNFEHKSVITYYKCRRE